MSFRLLQQRGADGVHSVIAAHGDRAFVVPGVASIRALAAAIAHGVDLAEADAAGRLLAPIDHDDAALPLRNPLVRAAAAPFAVRSL